MCLIQSVRQSEQKIQKKRERTREKKGKEERERVKNSVWKPFSKMLGTWNSSKQEHFNFSTYFLCSRTLCKFFFSSFSFISLLICLWVRIVSFVAATKKDREDVTIIELNKYFHAPELLEVPVSENEKKKKNNQHEKRSLNRRHCKQNFTLL